MTALLRPRSARTRAVHCDGEALLKVPGEPIYFLNRTCNENPDGKEGPAAEEQLTPWI